MKMGCVRNVDPVSPVLQVFQVRKVQGTNLGKIYAMKVLRKVSHLPSQQKLSRYHPTTCSRLWEDSCEHDEDKFYLVTCWLSSCFTY